jgi:hypothetical protein
MFCTQDNQYFSPAVPGTREKLDEILDSPQVRWKIESIRQLRQPGAIKVWGSNSEYQKFCIKEGEKKKTGEAFKSLTDEEKLVRFATSLKESLPCLIFGAREFDELPMKKNPDRKMRRRVLEGIHLSGLFMFDGDKLPIDPRDVYERTQRQNFPWAVRLAHKTSSGHGIRLVCEALPEIGNIADNQIELARELGLLDMTGTTGKPVTDDSCIDASRISYAPRKCDIYYINEDKLFNF